MMVKTKITFIGLLISFLNVSGQTGDWSSSNFSWNYEFDTARKLFGKTASNGVVKTVCSTSRLKQFNVGSKTVTIDGGGVSANFMPAPPSGQVRTLIQTEGASAIDNNGLFDLDYISNTFKIVSSRIGNPNKLGIYGIIEATPVAAISFNITFNETGDNGVWYFNAGKKITTSNSLRIWEGDAKINPTVVNTDVFLSLKWELSANNELGFYSRTSSTTSQENLIETHPFVKGGSYDVELYCNNTANEQSYTVSSIPYPLPARSYHIWVNGVQLEYSLSNKNFPASLGELAVGQEINSFNFDGFGNTLPESNSAEIVLKDISLKYTEGTLPVKLTSFRASEINNKVQLNWTTASEQNNSFFDVMRSGDGVNYQKIGEIKGMGDADKQSDYRFTDNAPYLGMNYYYLVQVDFDGKTENTFVVSQKIMGLTTDFKVLSVSGNDIDVFIYHPIGGTEAQILISDIYGRTIHTEKLVLQAGKNNYKITTKKMVTNVFVATAMVDKEKFNTKFIR